MTKEPRIPPPPLPSQSDNGGDDASMSSCSDDGTGEFGAFKLFRLAEKLLMSQPRGGEISSIYMVGDNPAADVRGARNAGKPWIPVLVRTGVFSGEMENSKHDPADNTQDKNISGNSHRENQR